MKIRKDILSQIFDQAKEGFPDEVCGLLGGTKDEATVLFKMENDTPSPVSYSIHPRDLFDTIKKMRESKLELVAIYHSHVATEPYPSETDIELAFYPDSFYLIISLEDYYNPTAKAFRIVEKKITEVPLIVSD